MATSKLTEETQAKIRALYDKKYTVMRIADEVAADGVTYGQVHYYLLTNNLRRHRPHDRILDYVAANHLRMTPAEMATATGARPSTVREAIRQIAGNGRRLARPYENPVEFDAAAGIARVYLPNIDDWAVIDVADYGRVRGHRWRGYRKLGEHTTYVRASDSIQMHRLILTPPDDMVVDHINHNGLDNRRVNIRVTTQKVNSNNRNPERGRAKRKAKAEAFRAATRARYERLLCRTYFDPDHGVRRANGERGWIAQKSLGGVLRYLGYHETQMDAKAALVAFVERHRQEIFGKYEAALEDFPEAA